MGALTFKPSSFQTRPWELTRILVTNHFEGTNQQLLFSLRGTKVVQITTSSGWLIDRVRFGYDSFRRQRLTQPLLRGQSISWEIALTYWLVITLKKKFIFHLDRTSRYFGWLFHGYNLLKDPRGLILQISYNSPLNGSIYHGSYGLVGCFFSVLSLPMMLSYEENNTLSFPSGVVSNFLFSSLSAQLFKKKFSKYQFLNPSSPKTNYTVREQAVFFQVSPLQHLLGNGTS